MRQFTPFASYHDNTGRLLVGRVRFCDMLGRPAEVKAEDGETSLGSTIFTDSSGRLVQQPFLDDHDYLVYFDKYIGESDTMSEDDDPESWEEQGSAIDRYNTLGVSLTAESKRTIGTIAELRTTAALDEDEILVLMGYNEAGDKEPICYKWNPESVEPDNGGSIIAVSGTQLGRWEIVECPRVLDVRHFGAFPGSIVMENTSQRYRLQAAGEYAHANGCGIFFPANDVEAFYDISGLTLYDVDCSPKARVYAVSSSYGTTITGIRKIYCTSGISCKGIIRLVDEVVRSSWEGDSGSVKFEPSGKLLVDKPFTYHSGIMFSNIEVEFLVYSRVYLKNCQVVSNKKINSYITLEGCVIDTSWFADDYDWRKLSSYDNVIKLHNCKDANTYITLKNKQGEKDYGDLGEQKLSEITLASGCIAENALFENVVLSGDSELHNVSGSVTISASATTQNWVDCWLSIGSDTVISNFSLRRGSVSGGKLSVLTSFLAHDAEIIVPIDLLGALPDVRRCKIACKVVQKDNAGVMSGTFESCTFNAVHELDAASDNTVVNIVWRDNYATVEPISVVNRAKFAFAESAHSYVYENNGGAFVQGAKEFVKDATITVSDGLEPTMYPDYVAGGSLYNLGHRNICAIYFHNGINNIFPIGISNVDVFRIGRDDFTVLCSWFPYETSGSISYPSSLVPQTFYMVMKKEVGESYLNTNRHHAFVPRYSSEESEPTPVQPTVIAFYQIYFDNEIIIGSGSIKGKFKFSKV